MSDTEFWGIIENALRESGGNADGAEESLLRMLASYRPQEIAQFQTVLRSKLDAAYTWELWGAAYLINGGCSDDGFEYFRLWLISRGRSVYELAVADPDSLADVILTNDDTDDHEFESLLYVAHRAFEHVTGFEMPPTNRVPLREPKGSRWNFDDSEEVAARLPRLKALLD